MATSTPASSIPRRRRKRVSLLLPPITMASIGQSLDSSSLHNKYCGITSFAIVVALVVLLTNQQRSADIPISWDVSMEKLTISSNGSNSSSSRPFQFIGDIDPSEPQPWPEEEKDWHSVHELLVKRVKESDALPINQVRDYHLPQLIFYGDSITEGWNGTSFGNLPAPHRMWTAGEDESIRKVFANAFGDTSDWGGYALKPPLILGISGSRTYDFIWRVRNGEFPVSSLLQVNTQQGADDNHDDVFQIQRLERIYVLLIGTNNLGGGMLPGATIKGMDAAGRTILQLHEQYFPHSPAAMLLSELLPRKDDFRAVKMCPPRCKNVKMLEPYQSFIPAIEKVNRALPTLLDGWREDYPNSRIILLSAKTQSGEVGESKQNDSTMYSYTKVITCGKAMFAINDDDEFDVYMPDRLHPNAKGYKLWSLCLKKGLDAIMKK